MDRLLRGLTDGLNQADKTKFFSALNAVDWSDIDSLESLPDTLKELNVSVDPTALNDYIAALGEANGAIRNIDLNKLYLKLGNYCHLACGIYDVAYHYLNFTGKHAIKNCQNSFLASFQFYFSILLFNISSINILAFQNLLLLLHKF